MLDQGKFCWYDALRDFVISSETGSQFNVFGLLTSLVTTRFKDCVVEVSGLLLVEWLRLDGLIDH
jgi:hypothetical protein